ILVDEHVIATTSAIAVSKVHIQVITQPFQRLVDIALQTSIVESKCDAQRCAVIDASFPAAFQVKKNENSKIKGMQLSKSIMFSNSVSDFCKSCAHVSAPIKDRVKPSAPALLVLRDQLLIHVM